MSKFQQLVKGAASAIRKAQEELRALSAPEAQQVPEPPEPPKPPTAEERLAALAKNKFAGAPGGFKLYHGSPHTFEKFDFLNNLKRGEGALAFGPGGYMTGNEPLAKKYASVLGARGKGTGLSPHAVDLLSNHKDDFLEFLRLGTAARLAKNNPAYEQDLSRVFHTRKRMVERTPERYGPYPAPGEEWIDGVHGRIPAVYEDTGPATRVVTPVNFAQYLNTMRKELGKDLEEVSKLKLYNSRAARNARDMGFDARQIMKSGEVGVPSLKTKIYAGAPTGAELERAPVMRSSIDSPYGDNRSSIQARNLHNLNQAIAGNPKGKARAPYSFGFRSRADLLTAGTPANRNLYELDAPFSPEDLLPYDYPLEYASPKVLGALARMAEDPELSAFLPSGMTVAPERVLSSTRGSDLMRHLKNFEPRDAAMAMKRAGIPGLYFERGGQRGGGLPERFDPDMYNFVIFDDEQLPVPKRTQFAHGGHAVK